MQVILSQRLMQVRVGRQILNLLLLGQLDRLKGNKFHLIPGKEQKGLEIYAESSATKASNLILDFVTLSSELPPSISVNRIRQSDRKTDCHAH